MKQEIKQRIEQINNGMVPVGYKKTKLGVIPYGWEVCHLTYLFSRLTRKNKENNNNVLTISAQKGLISQTEFFNKDIASDDKSNYYLLQKGDFAYNKSYSSGYPYGAIKELSLYDKGIVSPLYICMQKTRNNKCPSFYLQYFEAGMLNREIKAFAQEGARNHGLLNIAVGDFFNSNVIFPPIAEQKKIAEILATQDRIIELKQKQIEKKEQQKKYLSQVLLSKKDGWKEFEIGQLFGERNETRQEDLQLLAITGTKGVVPRDELDLKDNSSEDKSKYKKICVGDIGYNTMRMWQGVSAVSKIEGIVSPAYTILKPVVDMDISFFGYLFKTNRNVFLFYRFSQGIVDDTRSIKYNTLKKLKIWCPVDIQEQRQIARLLDKATEETELLKKDLEQEKLKKKALMQLLLTGIVRVK